MALSDILASLRDYFTGGQSEQDRAEEQAAALAEQTANIVT